MYFKETSYFRNNFVTFTLYTEFVRRREAQFLDYLHYFIIAVSFIALYYVADVIISKIWGE